MEGVWSDKWDPTQNIRFPWNIWIKNSGIIGCLNEASMEFMIEMNKSITKPGKVFRAWKKGEYGFSCLVTLILPPGSDAIKREVIVPLVLKQNGLVGAGQHTTPRFKERSKEVTIITMGVSLDLAPGLRNLGGFAAMGVHTVKVHLKK
jgi:hypothetical protein